MSNSSNQAGTVTPAKKPIPLWLKIVGSGVAVIIVIVTIAMWATSGLMDPINRHLDALKAGNMEAAYAETSRAFIQNTTFEQYGAFVKSYPILTNFTEKNFSSRSVENNIGKVEGTLTDPEGTVVPISFQLVKENDIWVILGLNLGG
ncbi:MAG: DUF4864 domain-containing protein [Devosiaceae bacterium]|nr:DUF4864 domain-containing protein [Devosiaceae bacterium]